MDQDQTDILGPKKMLLKQTTLFQLRTYIVDTLKNTFFFQVYTLSYVVINLMYVLNECNNYNIFFLKMHVPL